jgi:HAD superfamily hydrolase (TIGR01509 family)
MKIQTLRDNPRTFRDIPLSIIGMPPKTFVATRERGNKTRDCFSLSLADPALSSAVMCAVCNRYVLRVANPYDLIIFDCDGVLVDSERLCVQVESEMITAEGWEVTPAEVASYFLGKTDDYMLAEIERRLGRSLGASWLSQLHECYEERFEVELQAVQGVKDLLDALVQARVPMCVASSGKPSKMAKTLGITGLSAYFDDNIYSATEVERGKPAPDLFLHAATSMGVAPERCAVVEDSPAGVEAARAAGMTVFAFETELVSVDVLRGPSTTVFAAMRELIPAFTIRRDGKK